MSTATMRRMRSYDDAGMSSRAKELDGAVADAEEQLRQLYRDRALEAQAQFKQGHPMQIIATRFGVSRQTIHGWIKSLEVKE